VFAGTGLGAGYVLDGELVRGAGGCCGEIGHTCIDLRRKKAQLCGCGRRGCLETFASKSGLLGWLRERHPAPGPDTAALDRLAPEWRSAMVGSKQLRKAAKSDEVVERALRRAAEALGAAAANVLTTTGCEAVVLGGGLVEELPALWPRVLEAVEEHSFAGTTLAPLVRRTVLGDLAVAVGAAAYCRRRHLAIEAVK
jgi:glucokinase